MQVLLYNLEFVKKLSPKDCAVHRQSVWVKMENQFAKF